MSIDDQIENIIKASKRGSIFFPVEFKKIGSQSAIHTTLHRLEKKGLIVRLAKGIYTKPKLSKLLNTEVLPSLEEIANAIAKRDNARLLPSGSYALYALGISTQIPLKLVYKTDGKARTIKVGERTIQFRKTSAKKLSLKGKISKLVIQALTEIGKEKLTESEKRIIFDKLKKEDIKDLKHDLYLAPQWIAEIMSQAI